MKYANLSYIGGSDLDEEVSRINIGDYMQLLAIDAMYQKMGIPYDEICHITIDEMKDYKGEYLILPINFMIDSSFCENDKIAISEYIIPVFIGICLYRDGFPLNEYNINYLKRFAPIGCRDYNTYMQLQEYGIPSYFAGCISLTLSRREKTQGDTVYFVDVPDFVKGEVPKDYFKKCKFVHHERELTKEQFYDTHYAYDISKELLLEYYKNARLIITSRLHCSSPCIGMGIPTILIREYRGYTFDWINQFVPIYLWEDRHRIDWYPKELNLEKEKEVILNVAIQRIKDVMNNLFYLKTQELFSKYYVRKNNNMLGCQSFGGKKIEEKLKAVWETESEIRYALWGVSESAEEIYAFIQKNYKNATLVKVIDTYREVEFHGIKSEKPEIIKKHNDFFTIVVSINASNAAKVMFDRIQKPIEEYVLIADTFMNEVYGD